MKIYCVPSQKVKHRLDPFIFIFLLLWVFVSPVKGAKGALSYDPHTVLVEFKPDGQTLSGRVLNLENRVTQISRKLNVAFCGRVKIAKTYRSLSKASTFVLIKSNVLTAKEIMARLKRDPDVKAVSFNYRRRLLQIYPNDPLFNELWGLNNTGQGGGTPDADIDAPEAWDVSTGSTGVVAVVDTGVDYTHEDLAANMWRNSAECNGTPGIDDDGNGFVDDCYGYDFAGDNNGDNDPDPRPDLYYGIWGHGTLVAGIIAAVGNNNTGVTGVNWHGKIMALKMFRPDMSGFDADAVEAIDYAVLMKNRGVNIVAINASWGEYEYSQVLKDAIEAAGDAGILFVAAAGNEGNDNDLTPLYPCGYGLSNIICVGATDKNDQRPNWSNFGFGTVDVGAPGAEILTTLPGGGYLPQSGDIFFDDMESANGKWEHGGINDSWTITAEMSHSASHAWSDSPDSEYRNNTNSWLAVKNDIDLSSHQNGNVMLGFWIKYSTEYDHDYLSVEFSEDGGVSWKEAGRVTGSNNNFELVTVPVPRGFRTHSFRFRFRLFTNGSVTEDGVYIDDVGVGIGGPSDSYENESGTSMATPYVTGAVALMASVYPAEDMCHRLGRIFAGVDVKDQFQDLWWSSGRLNLYNSITGIPDPVVTSVSPAEGVTSGAQFTITGCGFRDFPGQVVFSTGATETQAPVVSWSNTSITAKVPGGTGKYVRVVRADGRKSNVIRVSEWSMKHAANTARSDAAAVVYRDKIYLFGGSTDGMKGCTNTGEVYDPASDTWTGIAPMSTKRARLAAAEAGGRIYIIGGYNDDEGTLLDTVEAYDSTNNTWETSAPLPQAMAWMKAVSLNGKIYVTGGYDRDGHALSTLYEYNPDTDTWTQKASMNHARYGHGAVALGGKIYVFGGKNDTHYLTSAEVYDPATDTWTSIADMPLALSRMGAATDGERIYLVGGTNTDWWDGHLPVYIEYNAATDTYTWENRGVRELITSKSAASLVYVLGQGALFSVGGLAWGETSLNELERLDVVMGYPEIPHRVNATTFYGGMDYDTNHLELAFIRPEGLTQPVDIYLELQQPAAEGGSLYCWFAQFDGGSVLSNGIYFNNATVACASTEEGAKQAYCTSCTMPDTLQLYGPSSMNPIFNDGWVVPHPFTMADGVESCQYLPDGDYALSVSAYGTGTTNLIAQGTVTITLNRGCP